MCLWIDVRWLAPPSLALIETLFEQSHRLSLVQLRCGELQPASFLNWVHWLVGCRCDAAEAVAGHLCTDQVAIGPVNDHPNLPGLVWSPLGAPSFVAAGLDVPFPPTAESDQ